MNYTYNFPNVTNGLDNALVDLNTTIPSFTPLMLLFVYVIVLLGGINLSYTRRGEADVPLWAMNAGISTTLVSLMMTLKSGLINLTVLTIVVSFTILSAFWFFMSRSKGEV